MTKDLYDKMVGEEKKENVKKGGSKKMLAIVVIAVVAIAVAGFALFYSGLLPAFGESITNPNQAAGALSGLGNDASGITEDLKDIGNRL